VTHSYYSTVFVVVAFSSSLSSLSLTLPHITPNSLSIAATAPLLPPQPADKKKGKKNNIRPIKTIN